MKAPKYLQNHSQFSAEDYAYLAGKGYNNQEIKAFWDRDADTGNAPQQHYKWAWA